MTETLIKIISNIANTQHSSNDLKNNEINLADILNSIDYVKLIIEIEKVFEIELPDEALIIENFSKLNDIKEMIMRCKNGE